MPLILIYMSKHQQRCVLLRLVCLCEKILAVDSLAFIIFAEPILIFVENENTFD